MLYLIQYSNKSVLVNNNNILIYKNNILIRFLNILVFEYFVFDNSNIVECILLLLDLVILAVRYSSFPSDFPSSSEEDQQATGDGINPPPEEESDIGDISLAAFLSSLSDSFKSFLSSLGPVGRADGELFSSSSSSAALAASSSSTLDVLALASFLLTSSKFSTKSGTSSSSSSSPPSPAPSSPLPAPPPVTLDASFLRCVKDSAPN